MHPQLQDGENTLTEFLLQFFQGINIPGIENQWFFTDGVGANPQSETAVGICQSCGRGTCVAHGRVTHAPRFRRSTGGIGGPVVRVPGDRPRWLCLECHATDATGEMVEADV